MAPGLDPADRVGEDPLQGVEVSADAGAIDLRPGPVDAAVMRVIDGPVAGQGFALGSEERVQIIGAGDGVFPVVGMDPAEEFARRVCSVLVGQDGEGTVEDPDQAGAGVLLDAEGAARGAGLAALQEQGSEGREDQDGCARRGEAGTGAGLHADQ